MAKPLEYQSFCHIINFNRFDKSIEQLMARMNTYGVCISSEKLIPTLIHLRMVDTVSPEHVPVVRVFLKKLRDVQMKHFVRFATTLEWVMESDCYDVLYTRPDVCSRHKDASINVKVMDSSHILLTVSIPYTTKQHHVIRDLSKRMIRDIPASRCHDQESVFYTVTEFYKNSGLSTQIQILDDDLHILLIPSVEGQWYHPIPLHGLSVGDAHRRFVASHRSLESLSRLHDEVIPDQLDPQSAMVVLVEQIQHAIDEQDRYTISSEIYGLAELLFGHYIQSFEDCFDGGVGPNELLLFTPDEDEHGDPVMDIYKIKVTNVINR